MKVLKWIGILILIIIGIVLIINVTQDDHLTVEESVVIDAPAEKVYSQIADFNHWEKWSAWSKIDPNMVTVVTGEPGTVGHKNSWKSDHNQVGNGSQELVEVNKPSLLKSKMLFEGFEGENYATFTLSEAGEGKTKVVWDFEGAQIPFMFRFMNLLMKPSIEDSYRSSLNDLKEVVESMPTEIPNPGNFEVVEAEPIRIISIRDTTTAEEIANKLRELYTELSIYMTSQKGLEKNGSEIGIYHYYSEEMVDMEAAFPISGDAVNSGRVKVGTTPQGKALKGIHMGDYNSSEETHMAMEEYVNANPDIEFKDVCWEVYVNDPNKVDSADIKTEIYYTLK